MDLIKINNVPLYFQCLKVDAEWRLSGHSLSATNVGRGYATLYDPWEKRNEFFALRQGDSKGLLNFIGTVGLFDAALGKPTRLVKHALVRFPVADEVPLDVLYVSELPMSIVWGMRDVLTSMMKEKSQFPNTYFQARLERLDGRPRTVFTTVTFVEAITLSLAIDVVRGAKFKKCKRPDCPVIFAHVGNREKKYHCQYCAHVDNQRDRRAEARRERQKQKKRRKGKSA